MKIYRKIGTCVHLVDEQNTDLKVSNLLGIAKDKCFMPSVANVIGTDLSKYNVIRKGRFACNLMHVNRDEVLPVALYMDDNPAIISPAYPMFEVNDPNELMPEYLNMYLMRKEFDREVVFYAMNGVRGGLEWEDFMDIEMPVPDIEEQRRIVSEYQTIERRMDNNNRLLERLENTASALYYRFFKENIDIENLPSGWLVKTAVDVFPDLTIGKTPPREIAEYFRTDSVGVKWVSIADMRSANPFVFETKECLTKEAVDDCHVVLVPRYTVLLSFKLTVGRVAISDEAMCTNEAIAHFKCKSIDDLLYPYYYLKSFDYTSLGNTSSISDAINSTIIKSMPYVVPDKEIINQFNNKVRPLMLMEYNIGKENQNLKQILNLLCAKLS